MACMEVGETQRASQRFLRQAMMLPLLEAEHELELARRWRDNGDEEALHELTRAYMRLVIAIASRFRNYGLPFSDLVQEGNVGLMQAAARFEPERELRFSAYATWWIRAAVQDYILRNWSIVRTGTTTAHKSLFFNLRRLRALIDNGTRHRLTEADRALIADHLGVGIGDVETMDARLLNTDRSLNAPIAESAGDSDMTEWQDILRCDRPLPEDETMAHHDDIVRTRWVEQAMTCLSPRETTIIRERQLTEKTATLEVLAGRFGISKERVRQIEQHALGKLRASLVAQVADPRAGGLLI